MQPHLHPTPPPSLSPSRPRFDINHTSAHFPFPAKTGGESGDTHDPYPYRPQSIIYPYHPLPLPLHQKPPRSLHRSIGSYAPSRAGLTRTTDTKEASGKSTGRLRRADDRQRSSMPPCSSLLCGRRDLMMPGVG
ncbi:hypothetical protein K458DRAFT_190910 [Lentithecium fluviatile CBS 122367]|uniref:Uncharacterized protein n=1 Tax=Lentithecium fluviatile CBS 122367 TaxID=1168545 RepID=A0A6G1JA86_9PLEO|nr:hypothetical protein K458DRAFT_190910 [Lentithecium fluviatile CBS 122367]